MGKMQNLEHPGTFSFKVWGFSSKLDLGFTASSAHGRPLGHHVGGRANKEKTAGRLDGMGNVFLSGN